jgi:virginiamycin A acetyltransferase
MTAARLKVVARSIALVLVWPAMVSARLRGAAIGRDRAFQHSTEWLGLLPGLSGQYARRAFLQLSAAGCGPEVVIEHGTTFSSTAVRIDGNAYVGANCNIGWAHIATNAMVASDVHILSGARSHGIDRLDLPMRDQPGTPVQVSIGQGAWIGNRAVVMADVGRHAIVAAGAVVTRPVPDFAIVAGVPARIIRSRLSRTPE